MIGVAAHNRTLLVGHVQRERRAGRREPEYEVLMSQQCQVPNHRRAPRQFFTRGGLCGAWAAMSSPARRGQYSREERRPLRESGVIVVTGNRADALAGLDVFVGEWVMQAWFPGDQPAPPDAAEGGPTARSRFEWALDRQFLLQRTEIPAPEAPDSLSIISVDLETGAYTQHYYDSRGVVRLYTMTFAGGVWTLTRESPDFSPLEFQQRYTAGRF